MSRVDGGVYINLYTGEATDDWAEVQTWERYMTVGVVINGEWITFDKDVAEAYRICAELNKEV